MQRADLISISLFAMFRCSKHAAFINTSPRRQIGGGFFFNWGPKFWPRRLLDRSRCFSDWQSESCFKIASTPPCPPLRLLSLSLNVVSLLKWLRTWITSGTHFWKITGFLPTKLPERSSSSSWNEHVWSYAMTSPMPWSPISSKDRSKCVSYFISFKTPARCLAPIVPILLCETVSI